MFKFILFYIYNINMQPIESYIPKKEFKNMSKKEIVNYIKLCMALDKKGGRRKTRRYTKNRARQTRKLTK